MYKEHTDTTHDNISCPEVVMYFENHPLSVDIESMKHDIRIDKQPRREGPQYPCRKTYYRVVGNNGPPSRPPIANGVGKCQRACDSPAAASRVSEPTTQHLSG